LLEQVSELYEVVLFTASVPAYANAVTDRIDPGLKIPYRLFRDSCVPYTTGYVKDLNRLARNLSEVIIVDNSPTSF
jgi:RNA polymerase II subunit A small phosphatase-like protein